MSGSNHPGAGHWPRRNPILSPPLFRCLLPVLFLAFTSRAQVTLPNAKLDVLSSVSAGSATLTSTPLDLGVINNVFDSNTNSLARTPNINPAFVQVAYTQARTLRKFRVYLSYGTSYQWWVEKADSQADMESRAGSYAVVTPTNSLASWTWSESDLPAPVTANLFKLNVQRFGGDGYCHMNERTPRLSFDPTDTTYHSGLPTNGQPVTCLAHVKNWGTNPVAVPFEWRFDGATARSGSVTLGATQAVALPFAWSWETNTHTIEFRADPDNTLAELSKLNNRRVIRSNALLVGLWVEQSLYNYFHNTQYKLLDGANSFEDWGQRMVDRWNWTMHKAVFPFAPDAFLDDLSLDEVVIVPDNALPLAGGIAGNNPDSRDRTVDMEWGYPWNPDTINPGQFYGFRWNGPFLIDFGSIHEMNHARYHVDLYALDENHNANAQNVLLYDDGGALVPGSSLMPFIAFDVVYYNKWRDIMGAGSPIFDGYSAGAWNWKHHRRGQGNQNAPPDIGRFLNDLPATNRFQFIDQNGVPMAGADVYYYRANGGFYTKRFQEPPQDSFVTDQTGTVILPRNPFGGTLPLGGFGPASPDIIFKVRYHGEQYYFFQEVTDFNIQYWSGNTNDAVYLREIDLRDNPTTIPTNSWLGNYFNGDNFQAFAADRVEPGTNGINFSWTDVPAPGVDPTNFTVYWEGRIPFTEGWKIFNITSDGGFRLWIDGRIVFDQWTNSTLQTWMPVLYTAVSSPFVNPGQSIANGTYHRVEVRYRHNAGNARVQLSWSEEAPADEVPVNVWRADYYTTKNLAGYMLSRTETAIDYDYQFGSPDPAVGGENFSARWTGDWDFDAGTCTFKAITDDGMRVYVDDVLALNEWFDQPPTTYTFARAFGAAGRHRIRVEYYENTITARAYFGWTAPPTIITEPQSRTVLAGSNATFTVVATGTPPPTYQWQLDKLNVPGATAPTLTLTNVQATNAGNYRVVVSNSADVATSQMATLTVVPASAQPEFGSNGIFVDGRFQLTLNGETGWNYRIDASTNFIDWQPLTNLATTNGPLYWVDANATSLGYRFYRAVIP